MDDKQVKPQKIAKISTEVEQGDENPNPRTPEEKLSSFLIRQIQRVGSGEINMAQAKRDLADFWKSLPKEERQFLYNNNLGTAVATRVKNYADSLATEMPMLLGQFSRGD